MFRAQARRLAMLLGIAATADLPIESCRVNTPIAEYEGAQLSVRIALVPILRAGLGLVEPLQELMPDAEVWHLGMYRDERTAQPVEYYCKLRAGNPCDIGMVLDPMLATGGSVLSAIESLKRWGCADIRVLSVLASRPGLDRLAKEHPDVKAFVCQVDPQLNDRNFIVPGLGDAGDRIFNTA
jgi:uracil phosphoribosyltransferase